MLLSGKSIGQIQVERAIAESTGLFGVFFNHLQERKRGIFLLKLVFFSTQFTATWGNASRLVL
jgi:hypothetical protein